MRALIILAALVGLSLGQGRWNRGRSRQSSASTADCPAQLQTLADCLADEAQPDSDGDRSEQRAQMAACFSNAGCSAPDGPPRGGGDGAQCLQQALQDSGLGSELRGCAASAGLPEDQLAVKMLFKGGRGGQGGRGGRGRGGQASGGRGSSSRGAGGRGNGKQNRLLDQCDGDSAAAEEVQSCLRELKQSRSGGQTGRGGRQQRRQQRRKQRGGDCMKAVDRTCLSQAKASLCSCIQPSLAGAKDDFVDSLQSCLGGDAPEGADPGAMLERVCSSGGRQRGSSGRGSRRGDRRG